ncbi:hypothetical protein TTHERM_00340200 (macronuclear) [Tetrahymena thermophila SB210]|uniref:Uncharacterized protein n=1 Tax=Tetrahymena thermophila (strain SB210) TaxID=312017 RepID=I7M1S1_TETTS|nr:hypothetical protein TTHERM_00340200 [Tetrahymena thermophila SB210]EAR97439.2 hypothetical protein TTHERM_00340200 [Tetrahymena thermophila SB210]|eukprot:XP_001017684.2 hypothetical protein TTHERM_00340200 [Tetrahymena thermophila SB210]
MFGVSSQDEKNFIFIQQIILKWQKIDSIYFPQSPSNAKHTQNEIDSNNLISKQQSPQEYNYIFISKMNQKINLFSEEIVEAVLDMLNKYLLQNQNNLGQGNKKQTVQPKSLNFISNRETIQSIDHIENQNPKIQVFDSNQHLQIEIQVSSKNIPLNESIEYQDDSKEGQIITIRNILQNQILKHEPTHPSFLKQPNIYELEEAMIQTKQLKGKKFYSVQEILGIENQDKQQEEREENIKNSQKETAQNSQQQQILSQRVDQLLQKWKFSTQKKFLNYKTSSDQQEQIMKILNKKYLHAKEEEQQQKKNQKQQTTTGISITANTHDNTFSTKTFQSVAYLDFKQYQKNPTVKKKDEIYFTYTSRPYSAKQRRLVSQHSNPYLNQSSAKTQIKSFQELTQLYNDNLNSNQQMINDYQLVKPHQANQNFKETDSQNVSKKQKKNLNYFQKVISKHSSNPFIQPQKPSGNQQQQLEENQQSLSRINQNDLSNKNTECQSQKISSLQFQNFFQNSQNNIKQPNQKQFNRKMKTSLSIEEDKNFKDNLSQNNIPGSISAIPEAQLDRVAAGTSTLDEFGMKTIFSIKDFDSKEEEWILNGLNTDRDKTSNNNNQLNTSGRQSSANKNINIPFQIDSMSNISQSNKGYSTPFSNRLSSVNINSNNINSPLKYQEQNNFQECQFFQSQNTVQQNQILQKNNKEIKSQNKFMMHKRSVPTLNNEKTATQSSYQRETNIVSYEKSNQVPTTSYSKSYANLVEDYYFTSNKKNQHHKKERINYIQETTQSANELSYYRISPQRKILSKSPALNQKNKNQNSIYDKAQNQSNNQIIHQLIRRPVSAQKNISPKPKISLHNKFQNDESLNKLMSMNNLFEGCEGLKNQAISQGLLLQNQLNTTTYLSKLQTQNSFDSLIQDKPAINALLKCQQLQNQYEEYEKTILNAYQKKTLFEIDNLPKGKGKEEIAKQYETNLQNNIIEQPQEENADSIGISDKKQKVILNYQNVNQEEQNELPPPLLGIRKCESELSKEDKVAGFMSNREGYDINNLNQNGSNQENVAYSDSNNQNNSEQSINQTPNFQTQGQGNRKMYIIEQIEKRMRNKLKTPSLFSKQSLTKNNSPKNSQSQENSQRQIKFHAQLTIKQPKPVAIIPSWPNINLQNEKPAVINQDDLISSDASRLSISSPISHSPQSKNKLTFTQRLLQFDQEQNQNSKKNLQNSQTLNQSSSKKSIFEQRSKIDQEQVSQTSEKPEQINSNSFQKLSQLRTSGAFKLSVKNIFQAEEKRKQDDQLRKQRFQQRQSYLSHATQSKTEDNNVKSIDESQNQQLSVEKYGSQELSSETLILKKSPYINRIKNDQTIKETSLGIDETKFSKINLTQNNETDTPNSQASYTNRPSRFKQQKEEALWNSDKEKYQLMITSHTNTNGDNDLSGRNNSLSKNQTPKNQIQFSNSRKSSIGFINFTDSLERGNLLNNISSGNNKSNYEKAFKLQSSQQLISNESQQIKPEDQTPNPDLQKIKEAFAQIQLKRNVNEIKKKYGKVKFESLIRIVSALKILLNIQERKRLEVKCKDIIEQCTYLIKSICSKQYKDKKNYDNCEQPYSNTQQNASKLSLPFRFMLSCLGSTPLCINVFHHYNKFYKSYGLLLKWEYSESFIPLELSLVQSLPFKHASVWPQYFIIFASFLVEQKIIKNIDSYPFDIYMENQKFSINFFNLNNLKENKQQTLLSQKITFEDVVLVGYLQEMIQIYMKNRFYFSYELTGFRIYENISPIITMQIEQAKSQIRHVERLISQQIDFNVDISYEPDYIYQGIKRLYQNFDKSMITYSPSFKKNSKLQLANLNRDNSSKYSISLKNLALQNIIQPLAIKLHQIFNEKSQQIDNLLATYKQPRHIIGFLQKVGNHFIMVDLKMCLQEQLNYNSLKLEKFDTSQISFLIKAKNLSLPLIHVDAREIGADEIVQFFGSLNFSKAIKMFVLRQRFPKIWRRKLLEIFKKFVSFSSAQNIAFDKLQGSQKNFKKNMTQNIIFMPYLPKEDRYNFKIARNIPILNHLEQNEQQNNYEHLFRKQFSQIYETNFVLKRDQYEDLNIFQNNLVQTQKISKIDYKDQMAIPIELTSQENTYFEQSDFSSSIACEIIKKFTKINQIFFLKNQQNQSNFLFYLKLIWLPNKDFYCFKITIRDIFRHSTKKIEIFDLKRTLLLANILLLYLENNIQQKEIKNDDESNCELQIIHRYVNYPQQICKFRDTIIRRIIQENVKTLGKSLEVRQTIFKNEQIGLRIKDDESILRHLIVRSPQLLNFFNVIQRSYILKNKDLGGRCSVSAFFYIRKSPDYNPNQCMLVYLNILPYNLRIKQFNVFLGYQDLQAVDRQQCLQIFEKNQYITENYMQTFAQKIVSQVYVFRTFLGMQLFFRQIRAPKPVRRKTLLLNSPYKKLANRSKYLLQNTQSIENQAYDSQRSGDSLNSRAASRHESDDPQNLLQKASLHHNLGSQLSTIHSPHAGNLGNYNHSQFQNYQTHINQSQTHNRMKDKHMKGIKNFEQSSPEKDLYQRKKAAETLTKIKYVRNKYTKYNFDQGIDKEISKPFLEEIIHQKRIIYQSAKKFNNQYSIVTVMRDLVFDSFCIQIYIPKMSRTIQAKVTLTKLVDCSWNFFSQVFKDKFFFFFDNSCYLHVFENYQRFALRCLYMEKNSIQNNNSTENLSSRAIKSVYSISEPQNNKFFKFKLTDENNKVKVYKVYSTTNMKETNELDDDEYKTYVSPNQNQVKLQSNEPVFNNFMKDILPQSQLYQPKVSFMLGINLLQKKERILKFLGKAMKNKESKNEEADQDSNKKNNNANNINLNLQQTSEKSNILDLKKKMKKVTMKENSDKYEQDEKYNQVKSTNQDKSQELDRQESTEFYQKNGISMSDYLGIPFLQDLESSDFETLSKIATSPRQLSIQLKKNQDFIKAQMDQRKSLTFSGYNNNFENESFSSKSQFENENLKKPALSKYSKLQKRNTRGLLKQLIIKHRLKLIYYKNIKRIFEFFRKENSRKIDRIYQFAALTEHIDTYYINQIESDRLKKLYNYIEIYIWEKLIQQFTTIQSFPDKDNMKQDEVEPYIEKGEEAQNNNKNENQNVNDSKNKILKEDKIDMQEDNEKIKADHQTYSVYLCIDNTTKLYLRELLHSDYMKIDGGEEYQTTLFVDFIKKTQEDNISIDSPKHMLDVNFFDQTTKKQRAEDYYFDTLPTIGYTESSNHIVYIKHQNLNEQTVQKMRINLREIINLFIAEGYFKSQTNYSNSKLSYAEMKQLCHFIIYKIKTNEFFDIVEIKSTIRNFYYHNLILDPVQKIYLKSVLDVNRKSIKFLVSKIGTFEQVSRVVPTQFFEAYVPFFQALIKQKQYNLALQRVASFYGSKMLIFFYYK